MQVNLYKKINKDSYFTKIKSTQINITILIHILQNPFTQKNHYQPQCNPLFPPNNEKQLDWIIDILRKQLAQPYSIYTYNYFLTNWPQLTIMAYYQDQIIGCIIGNYDTTNPRKAYIAMLVVLKQYRRLKIGQKLFDQFYQRVSPNVDKIVLQTQCINLAALKFYTKLGFFKTRRMDNYYLSGNDAFRLKLYVPKNNGEGLNEGQLKTKQQEAKGLKVQ